MGTLQKNMVPFGLESFGSRICEAEGDGRGWRIHMHNSTHHEVGEPTGKWRWASPWMNHWNFMLVILSLLPSEYGTNSSFWNHTGQGHVVLV